MSRKQKEEQARRKLLKSMLKELANYEVELQELVKEKTAIQNELALLNYRQGVLNKNTNLFN